MRRLIPNLKKKKNQKTKDQKQEKKSQLSNDQAANLELLLFSVCF